MKRTTILCAVVLVVGIGVFLGISFHRARRRSQALGCECRLSCLRAAKEQYALANGLDDGAEVDPDGVVEYMKGGYDHLICPVTGSNSYIFGKLGEPTRCTYHGTSDDCVHNF